ncbi:MAG: esterase/lipase family protein [Steroidobacteraceae bacterium]
MNDRSPGSARDLRPNLGSDHVTPYDRLVWSDEDVERLLANGQQREELEAFFGPQEHCDLARLAREAQRASRATAGATLTGRRAARTSTAPRVLIVPGIMGSQLGLPRREPLPRDIVWLDPIDIRLGRLAELALSAERPKLARDGVQPYGAVLYSYLRFKLMLRAAGLDAVFHPYDWRLGIDELGRELAERIEAEPGPKVAIVAHSLGGLVSRAALGTVLRAGRGDEKIERLVLLGTPNAGSFGAVQALRGTYAVVRKISRLDWTHSPEELATRVFTTFPSIYHMLPCAQHSSASWPDSGPQPSPRLLESARSVSRLLAPADERCAAIVGVGQETVTGAELRRGEFMYTVTRRGDGTVPISSARLEHALNYHAAVSHSDLTRDPTVAAAVVDLLRTGSTRRLPSKWSSRSAAEAHVSDRELGARQPAKVDWASLTPEERREFLQNLNEPIELQLRVPVGPRVTRAARRLR